MLQNVLLIAAFMAQKQVNNHNSTQCFQLIALKPLFLGKLFKYETISFLIEIEGVLMIQAKLISLITSNYRLKIRLNAVN